MTTRNLLHEAGHCLRVAAPPLLGLGVLALAGTPLGEAPAPGGDAEVVLVAWRAAVLGTLLWLLVAVVWAASRPLRDRRAFQRLQQMREIGTVPDRAMVHVQTIVWSSAAGQHVAVVNVATGVTSRVWLPETTVPIGSFVVLERSDGGVSAVDWMGAHQVDAAHRDERRLLAKRPSGRELGEDRSEHDDRDDVLQLIAEAEQFLKEQEPLG